MAHMKSGLWMALRDAAKATVAAWGVAVVMLAFQPDSLAGTAKIDRRRVSNVTVDLGPIREWKQTKKGERPLPHWKDASIIQLMKPMFGGQLCEVQFGGATKEIVVMHLPREMVEVGRKLFEAKQQLESAEAQVLELSRQSSAVREGLVYDPASTRLRQDAASIREAQAINSAQKQRIQATINQLQPKWDTLRDVLIMQTGKTISGFEIWEHGMVF